MKGRVFLHGRWWYIPTVEDRINHPMVQKARRIDAKKRYIIRKFKEGVSAKEIAKKLNCTFKIIYDRLRKWGIDRRYQSGRWSDKLLWENPQEFQNYAVLCRRLTGRVYNRYKQLIDPERMRSERKHLDHRFSIYEGFPRGVSPKKIAHPANLRIVSRRRNWRKNEKSSIDLPTLEAAIKRWETENGKPSFKPYHEGKGVKAHGKNFSPRRTITGRSVTYLNLG